MKKFLFLIIILSVIGAIIGGYVYSIIFMKDFRAGRAEARGMDYVSKVYTEYAIVGKTCQGEDTDDNSYVTCGFRIKNPEGIERTVRLECPTIMKGFFGSSCKEGLSIPENF